MAVLLHPPYLPLFLPPTPPPPPPPSSSYSLFKPGSSSVSSPPALVPLRHHTSHFSNYHPSRPTFSCNSRRYYADEDEDGNKVSYAFQEAVFLFNRREYYKCHDYLEHLWVRAEEPLRTLFHGILQCSVGFHHLFNQNHKGAMMELGEGLCKLRKMDFKDGPFHKFEREISAALDFVYETQIELAACAEDLCIAMDSSERSYQLLGGYGAGQELYQLQIGDEGATYIVFFSERYGGRGGPAPRTKLPALHATEEHLQHIM
ncbi:hypothetical protein MLD38_028846 [Melastoma candidum]|uniref:Uncharacterized protein n=1 Tax=Melastoma candidum TaxID=119954 RepID=A0ACB9N1W4_9MYRT|nr:hypothetical protein MLD38_028846 [Melastoma candidum]